LPAAWGSDGYDADTGELVAKALGVETCFVTPSWTAITAGKWCTGGTGFAAGAERRPCRTSRAVASHPDVADRFARRDFVEAMRSPTR
jgi:hypothetical protein